MAFHPWQLTTSTTARMSESDWIPIADASDWPLDLAYLSRLLDSKIPLKLIDGTCILTSPRSSEILNEIATLFECSPGVFSDAYGDPQALSMLDLMLSTIAALRAISAMSMNDIPCPTVPFWSLLLRSLSITCYEKSYILENVSFALPKPLDPNCAVLDGRASLLISHLADQPQPPISEALSQAAEDPSPMTENAAEPNHRESGCSLSEADEPLSEHSEDLFYESVETLTQPTSAPSSHVPVEAHVLSHWRQPDCVALPFLCIADEENIIPLVKSTVYQRYTWRISEPVVGVMLSETGCIGRVVMGWTDGQSDSDHVLPRIRIAYSDDRCPNSSLGIYDLTDPVSTIQLAQFILNLRQHVENVVSQSSNPTFRPILWRSDSIQMDEDQSGPEDGKERRIHIWLRDVPSPPQSDSASEFIEPPPSSEIAEMSKPSNSSKKSTSTSQSSLKPLVDAKQHHTSRGSSIVTSASARTQAVDGDPLSIVSFLSDRNVFSAARLAMTDLTTDDLTNFMEEEDGPALLYKTDNLDNAAIIAAAEDKEITAMAKIYDNLTKYQKPSWDTPPSVDVAIRGRLKDFTDQLANMNSKDQHDALDLSLMEIVISSLSFLLCVSAGGFAKGIAHKPNEAEARYCWNFLLYISFVVSGEVVSPRLLLERQLSLPRNVVLDLVSNVDDARLKTVAQAVAYLELCSRATTETHKQYGIKSPEWRQAIVCGIDASLHYESIKELMDAPNAVEVIKNRAREEPDTAPCDSFLPFLLSIPESLWRRSRPEPLVSSWDPPQPPSPNQLFKVEKQPFMAAYTEWPEQMIQRMKSSFSNNASGTQAFKLTKSEVLKNAEENLFRRHPLAVLISEYQKPDEEAGKAMNRCKVYLASAVMHLKSLGITRYPVFGLATNGTEGDLLGCWYSRRLDRIFMMDRNIVHFDISSPVQAYHFMTFLLRLRRWSDEQLMKYQIRISENADTFMADCFWTRRAQRERAEKDLIDTTGEVDENGEIVII
ncbi:hypothetical protein IW261DRAFT_1401862 [Armillaria novae-zelandiae]|uniref:Uncharacterized protein n=1 Tax=Armillaria novae-zelandiae TaxID=153914 RepID=A0AA39P3N3_9AGAR|nr:hypothetical protein IW261DRAFT_1401862 [Armillaria novae-zelandiae]